MSVHFLAADQTAASRLSHEIYIVLNYRQVHQPLSAIRINRVSAFQGEIYVARLGPIIAMGTL